MIIVKFLLFGILCFLSYSVESATLDERGTNAATVLSAGVDASSGISTYLTTNIVPYIATPLSYLSTAMNVLGIPFANFSGLNKSKQFKQALNDMNSRFEQLEGLINVRFKQMEAFIDRKQFQTDITDPSNFLWGQMMGYIQQPTNLTYDRIYQQCWNDEAYKIALKLKERLTGPDNSLMLQTRMDNYKNSTFMNFKEVFMYRTFQMVLVESFCVGLQNGPGYNQTEDYSWQQVYKIYTYIVSNIVQQRQIQEKDYTKAFPTIVQILVTSSKQKMFSDYAAQIANTLRNWYDWDKFGVIVSEKNCYNSQNFGVDYRSRRDGSYLFWSTTDSYHNSLADVYIIRYWGDDNTNSRLNSFQNCMEEHFHRDTRTWAENMYCGQDFSVLNSNWFCGGGAAFNGFNSQNFVHFAQYKFGTADAVFALRERPGNVTYDLGFWERPINIELIPN